MGFGLVLCILQYYDLLCIIQPCIIEEFLPPVRPLGSATRLARRSDPAMDSPAPIVLARGDVTVVAKTQRQVLLGDVEDTE